MPRVKPACVRRVSIGESSGSCSEEDGGLSLEDRMDRTETHMCPRCHEQFQRLHEFIHHKRMCDEKALQMGEDRMHSDPEDMVVSGDEEMDEPSKRLDEVQRHRQDAENNNSLEEEETEPAEGEMPAVGFPFPAASHVTLEALQNTKVAVAQFAATALANDPDNEAARQELEVLQSTLFTLQHQQVFQLQLIQQLQNQLLLTRRKEASSVSPPPSEAKAPTPTLRPTQSPSPSKLQPPQREPTPARRESPSVPPTSQSIPPTHSHVSKMSIQEPLSIPKPPVPSPPMMTHPPYSSISSSLASTIITNNDPPPSLNEPNTLEMLQKRAQEVLDNASQGLLANNLADELAFRKSGKMSPYDGKSGGRNEPFFKHRCRYCGKVFGSDSALQIHIRSHTGERPFKCNVCGSRFTTKGNLKVHFQRHTAKFPHVKMNPNPIPEHLDKYHPPILAQMSPGPISGMPPHPMQFPTSGPSPFPPGLPMYRPPHHDLMPPRPLSDKPIPHHALFALREEQDTPADLSRSKPTPPSPLRPAQENRFKIEPHDDDNHRESSFEDNERLTPKHEPEDPEGPDGEHDQERYPSSSPYDDCSTDSKYSNEDMLGRESPHVKHDPDQPENLSMRGNTTCNICYKTFACNSALEIHYRSHTKERPFKCTVCDRGFSTKSSGGGCRCGRRTARLPHATALNAWNAFVFPGNMKQHMLTHKIRDMPPHGFDKNSAGEESRDDSTDEPLPHHQPQQSPHQQHQTAEIKQEHCAKRSPPNIDMPLPKRPSVGSAGVTPSAPPAPPPSNKHLCGVCRKNFSSSSALQIHMRTHTGDKPFRCAVCQKAFTTKGNLKVHMGTHMWSSGASRRGRRMSLELPPRPALEPHELLRRPDLFYPYLPAPFLNGMQQKLNEISVIQQNAGQNGMGSPGAKFPGLLGFGSFPPPPQHSQPGSPLGDGAPPSLSGSPPRHASPRELAEREALLRELAERDRDALLRELAARARDPADHEAALREMAGRAALERDRELALAAADKPQEPADKDLLPRMWDLHYERKAAAAADAPGERLSPGGALALIPPSSRTEGLTV